MPVEFRDYYAVLGVRADASDAEIKHAYRRLARQFHPDVARNRSGAEQKFKEINEANEVLSDPEKRRKYDQLGADWNRPEQQAWQQRGGFGGAGDAGQEVHFDGTGFSDFFEQFFGGRGRATGDFRRAWADAEPGRSAPQRGPDIEGDILVTLDEVLAGSVREVRLQRTDARTGQTAWQTLRVRIPPGVREAQLIRLAGKGQDGMGGGEPGHLYLRVAFATHPEFRVRGADLYHDFELAPWEAVLGATVPIPTLDGMVSLRIPAGTTGQKEFRLRGKGLPAGDGARGDLYATANIQVPSVLTAEQKSLWQQLASRSAFNPRKNT